MSRLEHGGKTNNTKPQGYMPAMQGVSERSKVGRNTRFPVLRAKLVEVSTLDYG